jgi:hypothetical protein
MKTIFTPLMRKASRIRHVRNFAFQQERASDSMGEELQVLCAVGFTGRSSY